jgi:hypothetical protein
MRRGYVLQSTYCALEHEGCVRTSENMELPRAGADKGSVLYTADGRATPNPPRCSHRFAPPQTPKTVPDLPAVLAHNTRRYEHLRLEHLDLSGWGYADSHVVGVSFRFTEFSEIRRIHRLGLSFTGVNLDGGCIS